MIKALFYNSAERRLRSFWRLLLTSIVCFVGVLVLSVAIQLAVRDRMLAAVIGTVAILGISATCMFVAGRLLDRRPVVDFGLRFSRRWLADLWFGLLLGAILVSMIVLVEYLAGWVRVSEPSNDFRYPESRVFEVVLLVVLFTCVGVYEELLFRGYLLKNLAEGWSFGWLGRKNALLATMLFTSLAFAAVHLGNPHASLIAACNTVLSGILLSLGLLWTGELAIPIGFHITWNMSLCVLYGLPVSGMSMGKGLVQLEATGPEWLTGGAYGPEGGLLGTLAFGPGLILLVAWLKLNKQPLRMDVRLAEPPAASQPVVADLAGPQSDSNESTSAS